MAFFALEKEKYVAFSQAQKNVVEIKRIKN